MVFRRLSVGSARFLKTFRQDDQHLLTILTYFLHWSYYLVFLEIVKVWQARCFRDILGKYGF